MTALDQPESDVRTQNLRAVVSVLRDHGGLTRSQLVATTGLSRPTITAIARDLLSAGVVTEGAATAPGADGGRPGTLLHFRPSSVAVGVAFGRRDHLLTYLLDADGTELGAAQSPWSPQSSATDAARAMATAIDALAQQSVATLAAVAVVVPGVRDVDEAVTFPYWGWHRVPLSRLVAARLNVPVVVADPADAASMGQLAAENQTVPVVTLFIDFGLAVRVTERGVITVSDGGSSTFVHTRIHGLTPLSCECGRTSCLDAYAAGRMILRRVGSEPNTPIRALNRTDPRVGTAIDEAVSALAQALAWPVNLTNARTVVIADTEFLDGASWFAAELAEQLRRQVAGSLGTSLDVHFGSRSAITRGAWNAARGLAWLLDDPR